MIEDAVHGRTAPDADFPGEVDDLSDHLHGFDVHAAGRDSRGAKTDTTGNEGAGGFEGDGVLIAGDLDFS